MKNLRKGILFAAVWAAGLLTATSAPAQDLMLEDRLPSDVLMYLSLPDVPATVEQFHQTSFGQLFQDPSLAQFRSQFSDKLSEFQKKVESELDVPLEDVQALFAGEFSVAVVRPVGQPMGAVLTIEIGDNKDILDQLIARGKAEYKKGTIKQDVETVDGTEVITCIFEKKSDAEEEDETDAENPGGAKPKTVSYFVKDQTLAVSHSTSVLKTLLNGWQGLKENSFAQSANYKMILDKCRSGPRIPSAMRFYIDPVGLAASAMTMSPQTQLYAGMLYTPTFGLNGLKGIGGVVELRTDKYDYVSRTLYHVQPPVSGVLKFFQMNTLSSEPPKWVPADAGQYLAMNWNVQGAYQAVEAIADSFMGPGAFGAFVEQQTQQAGVDLNIKSDIVDGLTGQVQGYFLLANEEEPQEALVAIGATSDEKGQKLIKAITGLMENVQETEVAGVTVYQSQDEEQPVSIALQNKTIYFALGKADIKSALSSATESPLADSPQFKALEQEIPDEVSTLMYQNAASQLSMVYESLRNGDYDGLAEGEIDFTLLPPFEKLKKYLQPSVSYIVPDEQGAMNVQFMLKAKESAE